MFLAGTATAQSVIGSSEAPEQSLCPADYKLNIPKLSPAQRRDPNTHIDADSATIDSQSITHFTGNVVVHQGDKRLTAAKVTYDRKLNQINAQGNVVFTTGEMQLKGDNARLNLKTNQGQIDNAAYQTGTVNGRGKAKTILLESRTKLQLNHASYTTCPPGHVMWQLNASKIDLNNANHQGSAKNMVLDVSHVPILYLPYVRFPIGDQRLSGFLFPGLSVSRGNGTEITLPYYWNIAPDMDATTTLDNMSRRGLMLENNFRYLTSQSHGSVELDYMGMDTLYGDKRAKFDWLHQGNANTGWSANVDYNYVSDPEYFNDFSNNLTATSNSITALSRMGSLTYNQPDYVFTTTLQGYQILSGADQYRRLPQLTLNTRHTNIDNQFGYNFDSEFVNFGIHDPNMVTGQRIKLSPYIEYPIVKDAGFFKPKLTLNYLQYHLNNVSNQPRNPEVTVPVFSLDTGIYLDRNTSIGGIKLLQTLEPRLFYLYAPYRDQSMLPVFDTAPTTFSQTLMFSENRFSGNDRIGDANQVTAAISSQIYRQDNGAQLLDATIGQIFYFQNRRVVIPGQAVGTSTRSDYLGSLSFTPTPDWLLNGDFQYNPDTHHTEEGNVSLQYKPKPGRVVNLEYRYTMNQLRTEGASFAWRLNPRWQLFAGTQFDILNDHRLQNFGGLRYDSCCWGIRLVAGERFDTLVNNNPSTPRYEHAIYLEFMLKGLSSLGSGKDINTLLENGILGYSQ